MKGTYVAWLCVAAIVNASAGIHQYDNATQCDANSDSMTCSLMYKANTESLLSGDCDFYKTFCKWVTKGKWKWIYDNYNEDHTKKQNRGSVQVDRYVRYYRTNVAQLTSPNFPPTGTKSRCLTFWFRFSGGSQSLVKSLSVKVITLAEKANRTEVAWTLKSAQAQSFTGSWSFGRTPIVSEGYHFIIFEALKSNYAYGSVGLDDVIFTEGPCSVVPEAANKSTNATRPVRPPPPVEEPIEIKTDYDCTFDSGNLCQWMPHEASKADWRLQTGSSSNPYSGPSVDHTFGNKSGYYMLLKPRDGPGWGAKATIYSPDLSSNSMKCFSFYYYMWGKGVAQLSIYAKREDSTPIMLWARTGDQGPKWQLGQINITDTSTIKIWIQASMPEQFGIDYFIAVDDVLVRNTECHSQASSCDFEDGTLCQYKARAVDSSPVSWENRGGMAFSDKNVPRMDHTLNSGYGHYTSLQSSTAATADLVSPVIPMSEFVCLRFWYYISNPKRTKLAVVRQNDKNDVLFHTDFDIQGENHGKAWRITEIIYETDTQANDSFVFVGSVRNGDKDDGVALDDVTITEGFCGYEGDCNFDNNDFCTWNNDYDEGTFGWQLMREQLDHTTSQKGKYISAVLDILPIKGLRAVLYSQTFAVTVDSPAIRCLHFWYKLNGKNVGTLSVIQELESNSNPLVLWALKSEGAMTNWNYGKTPFKSSTSPFRLVFEALMGVGMTGEMIALDDIMVADADCSVDPSTAKTGTSPTPVSSTLEPAYRTLDCTFYNGKLCEWRLEKNYDFFWSVGNLSATASESVFVPPSREESDSYLYIESSWNHPPKSRAVVTSNVLEVSGETYFCFSFWSYMFGPDAGNLTLRLLRYYADGMDQVNTVLWMRIGSQMDAWQKNYVRINVTTRSAITFHAETGTNGVIALDDFEVTLTDCPVSRVCGFETSSCNWADDVKAPLHWLLSRGDVFDGYLPEADHTTLTSSGWYMKINNTNNDTLQNRYGLFQSPYYSTGLGRQCLTFWYYLNNSGAGALSVHIGQNEATIGDEIWKRGKDYGEMWKRAQVPLNTYSSFQIFLKASFPMANRNESVSIDDISLEPKSCDSPGTCTFDNGYCGYVNDVDDDFDWSIGYGRTEDPNVIQGPPYDSSGRPALYLYADMTSPWTQGTARIRSDPIMHTSTSNEFCIEFSYITLGDGDARLTVLADELNKTHGVTILLWDASALDDEKQWTPMAIPVHSEFEFEVLFEAQQYTSYRRSAFIAVDNVVVKNSLCADPVEPPTNTTEPQHSSNYCDFESGGFCDWTPQPKMKWLIGGGLQIGQNKLYDHTLNNYLGRYMYYNKPYGGRQNVTLQLKSNTLTKPQYCVTFWYYMYGERVGSLNIKQLENDQAEVIWSKSSSESLMWRHGQVRTQLMPNSVIIIEGFFSQQSSGFIAVDDIDLIPGDCPPEPVCTFDEGMCGISQESYFELLWQMANQAVDRRKMPLDHTTNSMNGNYLYLNTTGQNEVFIAENSLLFPMQKPVAEACLLFWLYMGSENNSFFVNVPVQNTWKEFKGITPNKWISAAVPVTNYDLWNSWQIVFTTHNDASMDLYMALDDIELQMNQSCGIIGECDFEFDNCLWHNHPGNNLDWVRKSGFESGNFRHSTPQIDHTTSLHSGHYVYIYRPDTAWTKGPARFLSSILYDDYKCFSFWHWASNDGVAILEFFKDTGENDKNFMMSLIVNGTRDKWILTHAAIPSTDPIKGNVFQIRIETTLLKTVGLIALDDFKFHTVPCNDVAAENIDCHDEIGTKVQQSQICNFVKDCSNNFDEATCGSCDFETNAMCQYASITNDVVRWEWLSAGIAYNRTNGLAPPVDHTASSNEGHYLIPVPPAGQNTVVRKAVTVRTPALHHTSATCHVVFWYMLQHRDKSLVGLLAVNLIADDGKKKSSLFTNKGSSPTGVWSKAEVYVGQVEEYFTVEFSVDYRYSKYSPLAIDDVLFSACGYPDKASECPDTKFNCSNSVCIDKWQVCDFTQDCGDGSDEESCNGTMMWDFTEGLGDWNSPRGNWVTRTSVTIRDHTTGIVGGTYLTPNRYTKGTTRMYSKVLQASHNCTARFYYFITGSGVGTMAVKTRSYSNGPERTYRKYDRFVDDYYFTRDQITFQEDSSFQVIFEAVVAQNQVQIALDDISFDSGCVYDENNTLNATTGRPDCAGMFQCNNSLCIKNSLVCDFHEDCSDGSDESNCGSCDFDRDLCQWNVNSPGMFRWSRQPANRFVGHPTLPDEDHSAHYVNGTFLNGTLVNGYFMVVEKTTMSHAAFPSAFLESPVFQSTSSSCKISFWYHLNSNDGNLIVKLNNITSKVEKTIAVLSSSEGRQWRPRNFTLGFLQGQHRVVFEADVKEQNADSKSVFLDFAIDDFEFFDCSPQEELNATKSKNLNCTFDEGLCDWYDDVDKDDLNWKVASGKTPTKGTGPETDHTDGTGNYLYLESTSKQLAGKTAYLLSPFLPPSSSRCLIFYYHMFGEHVNSLRVSLVFTNGTAKPIWVKLRSQSNSWLPGEVNINGDERFQIRFEGITGDGAKGDIALDDVFLLDEPCKTSPNFCDFEFHADGLCKWSNTEKNSKWTIKTGQNIRLNMATYPKAVDHTTGSITGHFLSAQIRSPQEPAIAVMESKVSYPHGCCVSLWYSVLTHKRQEDGLKLTITVETDYGNSFDMTYGKNLWEYEQFSVLPNRNFTVYVKASFEYYFQRQNYFIAVDDIEVVPGQCPDQGFCNFENGFCGWQNVKSAESTLDWLRSSGRTPSDYTGPNRDHTVDGNGFYLFVDASRGNEGNQAILESPEILYVAPEACIRFYYHMNGTDIGTLSMAVVTENTTLMYSVSGNQADVWHPAYIELHNVATKYRLQIAATVGDGVQGDIAIDDISLEKGNCTNSEFLLPPFMKLDTAASCKFDNNTLCSWQQMTNDDFNWTIGSITIDDIDSVYIPPNRNQSDSYIFVESDSHFKPGMRAEISTPVISHVPGEEYCFSFWYYIFGSNAGNLSLLMDIQGRYVLWKKVGAQVDAWTEVSININQPGNFTLMFEASIGYDGVIALDDFSVFNSRCPTVNVCTFELDYCNWQANDSDPVQWSFGRGSINSSPNPATDHSSGGDKGTYLLLRSGTGESGKPATGRLLSPLYPQDFGSQCVQFWYYMSESGSAANSLLEVYAVMDSLQAMTDPLWRRTSDHGKRWHRAQVTVGMYDPFQIVFQGNFSDGSTPAAIAIDDLQIDPSPCDNDGSCPFDVDMCGYTNDQRGDDFDWLLGIGRTENPKVTSGPRTDASEHGLYAYVDLTTPFAPPDGRARLRSDETAVPAMGNSSSYCLQFSYVIYGKDLATLTVYQNSTFNNNLEVLIQLTTENQFIDWTKMRVRFEAAFDFEIIFEVQKGENGRDAFIGIDSVSVSSGNLCDVTPPANTTNPQNKDNFCNFEELPCLWWKHDTTSSGNWMEGQGHFRAVNNSGPSFDHTTGTYQGRYLYVRAKRFATDPTVAVMESPKTRAGSSCVTFWYFIYGEHTGRLNVSQRINDDTSKILWTSSHTEGRKWRYAQVELLPLPQTTAALVGIIDVDDYDGYVAIDDINLIHNGCPPMKLCTFDEGNSCGYVQASYNEFDWLISNGNRLNDHTTNTQYGKFYYTNTTSQQKDQISSTLSPRYSTIDSACLKFWYFMGSDSSKLSVGLHDGYNPVELTTLKGKTQEGKWMNTYAAIKPRNDWQIEFRVTSSDRPEEVFVGLDDVEIIMDDTCQEAVFCDFERDTCAWENSLENTADWMRKAGFEHRFQAYFPDLLGPLIDHTTASARGYYIYIINANQAGKKAAMLSSVMQENFKCFSFWYLASADNVASLNLQLYSNIRETILAPLIVKRNDSWQWHRWDLKPPVSTDDLNFQLELIAQFGTANGTLAVDDIRFHSKACKDLDDGEVECKNGKGHVKRSEWCDFNPNCADLSDELACGNCDFDYDACDYVDVSRGHVRYEWTNASVAYNKTDHAAPSMDHSTETSGGHYVVPLGPKNLIVRRRGETAVLHSPLIQHASVTCQMSFWAYLPYSANTRSHHIQVSLILANTNMVVPIYEIRKRTGNWEKHEVFIGRIVQPFMVEFRAQWYRTLDAFSIDDINFDKCDFRNGSCDDTKLPCPKGGCYNKNQQCDFTDDCGDGADEQKCDQYNLLRCDFEESNCQWNNDESTYSSGFKRVKSAVRIGNIPTRDHTKGTSEGYFMLVDTRNTEKARLMGPIVQTKEKCTIRFYYFLNGTKDASLMVKAKNYTDGPEHTYLWRTRTVGPYFVKDEVTFDEGQNFQVIFEATVEEGSQDIVALDDISFSDECFPSNTPLPKNPDTPLCNRQTEFQCKGTEKKCIPLELLCDFNADCLDGSDEAACGKCDFQSGQCGWSDTSPGVFKWQRLFRPTPRSQIASENTGPVGGWMMQVQDTEIGHTNFPSAYLESHVFQETATTCSVTFTYQLSEDAGVLHVNLRNDERNYERTIRALEPSRNGGFETVQEYIGAIPIGYQLVFEADVVPSSAHRYGIAVTNVSFSNCSQKQEIKTPVNWDLNCTFDTKPYSCNWYQELTDDDIDWLVGSGATPTKGTGPEMDHTSGNGNYFYVTASNKENENKKAELVSRIVPQTNGRCLTFFYHMFGEHVNTLEVATVANGFYKQIWKKQYSEGNIWRPSEVNIISDLPYQIHIVGTTGIGEKSDIAIDDIKVLDSLCSDKDSHFCNFEIDECGFGVLAGDSPWVIRQTIDHTTGTENGQVLLSLSPLPTKNVSTQSPLYSSSNHESCVQFWAKSSGFGNVNLNVSILSDNKLINSRTTSMEKNDEWQLVTLTVEPNIQFQVLITAYVVASGESSYFDQWFVDDFLISNGQCPTEGSCDFENGMCGWTNTKLSYHWLRTSGSAPSDYPGPVTDHTFEDVGRNLGFYLFLDSEQKSYEATISSAALDVGPIACFSLFHSIMGDDIGTLSVSLSYDQFYYIKLHSVSGDQGGVWKPFVLELRNITARYWLQVSGYLNGDRKGNMAIDDLLLTKGVCNMSDFQPKVKSPPPTTISITSTIEAETTTPKNIARSTTTKENGGTTAHLASSKQPSQGSTTSKTPDLLQTQAEAGFGWIAAVVFIIAIAAVIGGLVWYRKHQQRMLNQGPISIDNPMFDDSPDGYQPFAFQEADTNVLTLMPDDEPEEDEGRVNPLYSESNDPVSSSVPRRHQSSSDT